jgi:hypothetical protein
MKKMLEIKSEWQTVSDAQGNSQSVFTIYMRRDKEWYNCASVGGMLADPDGALETIKCMTHNLMTACYPELIDPLYRSKQKLKELEFQIRATTQHIKDMEEAREKGINMYEEDNFCDYKECKVKFIEHWHIDEHTLTFNKSEEKNENS